MAQHEFKCPDCGRSCLLTHSDGLKATLQHELPTCTTYNRTKSDGQTFLELAFNAGQVPQLVQSAPDGVLGLNFNRGAKS